MIVGAIIVCDYNITNTNPFIGSSKESGEKHDSLLEYF